MDDLRSIHDRLDIDRQEAEIDQMITLTRTDLEFLRDVLRTQNEFHAGEDCFCDDMFVCTPVPNDKRHRCPLCQLEAANDLLKNI
jgi:hypothetical protein